MPIATEGLKELLAAHDPAFWQALAGEVRAATTFDEMITLSTWRRRAIRTLPRRAERAVRLAVVGAYSLTPLRDLIELAIVEHPILLELFTGDFDNYESEILDEASALYAFRPEIVVAMPAARRSIYTGSLLDAPEAVRKGVVRQAEHLLGLCRLVQSRLSCEVVIANHMLPAASDLGAYRGRTPASLWSYTKALNLELGQRAPGSVRILDLEYLSAKIGIDASRDARAWFESKQLGSPTLLAAVAREIAHLVASGRTPPKKVLVLDLDNTLWGGVIGDDGMDGIEIGTTSPRGEAFRAFQQSILELHRRGVLLAVSSKNTHATALEPFESHPEMVLRREHLAAFYANWGPKPDSLRAIAEGLELGTDSLVFVDDNPAEIEIVKQSLPEVRTLLVGPDPSDYVRQLEEARFFEPQALTHEDLQRGVQYRTELERKEMQRSTTDMDSYLSSLDMVADIRHFQPGDVPRISQLINKSNQFNLTTVRRSEAEVQQIIDDPLREGFTVRLRDRFGDHGLVAVVIARLPHAGDEHAPDVVIETWLMSCRVLNRQVEEVTLNHVFALARAHHAARVVGSYAPTAKNKMVEALYPRFGFQAIASTADKQVFVRRLDEYVPYPVKMKVEGVAP